MVVVVLRIRPVGPKLGSQYMFRLQVGEGVNLEGVEEVSDEVLASYVRRARANGTDLISSRADLTGKEVI